MAHPEGFVNSDRKPLSVVLDSGAVFLTEATMVRYTVTCCKCRAARRSEGNILGHCMDQAETDGWKPTGKMTYMMYKLCRKDLPN